MSGGLGEPPERSMAAGVAEMLIVAGTGEHVRIEVTGQCHGVATAVATAASASVAEADPAGRVDPDRSMPAVVK